MSYLWSRYRLVIIKVFVSFNERFTTFFGITLVQTDIGEILHSLSSNCKPLKSKIGWKMYILFKSKVHTLLLRGTEFVIFSTSYPKSRSLQYFVCKHNVIISRKTYHCLSVINFCSVFYHHKYTFVVKATL